MRLIREFGGAPYTDDGSKVLYNTQAGVAAVQWYSDLITKEKVSELGFMTDGVTAFRSGHAAMTIDGSFRLAAFDRATDAVRAKVLYARKACLFHRGNICGDIMSSCQHN